MRTWTASIESALSNYYLLISIVWNQVRRRNTGSPKISLEISSNGHSKSHKQVWQPKIDSCDVTASTSEDSMLESGPNLAPSVPKTGFSRADVSTPNQSSRQKKEISSTGERPENTTSRSNSPEHYPVGSNEKEFMEYLQAQAIQHEKADDSDYEVVRSREVCIFRKLNSLRVCNMFLSTHFISSILEILKREYICHLFKLGSLFYAYKCCCFTCPYDIIS